MTTPTVSNFFLFIHQNVGFRKKSKNKVHRYLEVYRTCHFHDIVQKVQYRAGTVLVFHALVVVSVEIHKRMECYCPRDHPIQCWHSENIHHDLQCRTRGGGGGAAR